MKVAITHDAIHDFGGAEKVLAALLKIYPQADVYTTVVNKTTKHRLGLENYKIKPSIINSLPFLNKKNSFVQMMAPFIWPSFSLKNYSLIISSSSFGLANTIRTNHIPHIQYIHSPPKNVFLLTPKWNLQKIIPYHYFLAKKYIKTIRSSPFIVTNSKHMQKTLKKMFGINSEVIYPPLSIPRFPPKIESREYFISVGRLDYTKSIDLAILACNKLRLPLKIVGLGPAMRQLKKIAGPTVEFLGFVPDNKLKTVYKKAKAFLFCAQNEDFGIAPVEAIAHGIPVIAYYGGGVKETLIHQKTGLFFYRHSVKSLVATLKKLNPQNFNPLFLYQHAQKFSEERFQKEFKKYVFNTLKNDIYK